MSPESLWKLDAKALATCLGEGTVNASDLAEMYLDRIDRLNGKINVFAAFDPQLVRQQATAAAKRHAEGAAIGPLDGIPVVIKDNIYSKDLPSQWGSLLYKHFRAPYDDICVERLRAGGAVLLGKTTTPEFSASGRTESQLTGSTRLPWDTRLTAGGSSGGSVAAVATGLSPLALGTDAGGSTRMPAAYNGLVGLRPSNGRIPRLPGFPPMSHDFQTIGLLARSVRDIELLLNHLGKPDSRDPASLRLAQSVPISDRTVIGWMAEIDGHGPDQQAMDCLESALAQLSRSGCKITKIEAPFALADLAPVWDTFTAAAAARLAQRFPESWEELMTPASAELARRGMSLSAGDYADAWDILTAFRARTSARWPDVDVIATPTVPAPAWPAEDVHPTTIGGKPGSVEIQGMYCGWVNAMGLPALSVPGTPHPDGRPLGVQLIGPFGAESQLLHLAALLEKTSGWCERWPELAHG